MHCMTRPQQECRGILELLFLRKKYLLQRQILRKELKIFL